MEKTITKNVPLVELTLEENVRLPQDNTTLSQDIEARGLTTRPLVWDRDGTLVILRGHRRTDALRLFDQRNPAEFAIMFPKGIAVDVVKNITSNRAADLKVDHGNERGLDHPHELQMSASMLFNADKSEKDVAIQLAGLMDRLHPMKATARLEYDRLQDLCNGLEGDSFVIARNTADVYLLKYRRGLVQGLNNAHRCPEIVMAALWSKATGKNPDGYTGKRLISLTGNNVTALLKAYNIDLEIQDGGVSKYSRIMPGPAFWEAWEKIDQANIKREENKKNGTPAAKSKSSKDLTEEAGQWNSTLARRLCLYHAGDKAQKDGLIDLDRAALFTEIMKEKAPETWAVFVTEAENLIKMQIEASTETV